MKCSPWFLIFFISFSACTCDTAWKANEQKIVQAPPGHVMPLDLFKSNVETTCYTALVHIQRVRVLKKPVWPFSRISGYVNHEYEAEVIETYRGEEHEKITYTVMAESDIDPYLPPHLMVVSLCGFSESGYYVPDNGYVSPASEELIAWGKKYKTGKKPYEKSQSVCE